VKILLVDDHRMMRDGLRAVLERKGQEVVGEASDGREAIALALRLRPQLVIMDITMPELNGVDATRRLVAALPGIKIIGLSVSSDRRHVVAMFEAGAVGYLLKRSGVEELLRAIDAVANDLTYVSPSVAAFVVGNAVAPASDEPARRPLTSREREVLQLVAEGHSSKDIAGRLAVAVSTVETHRRQIMGKLSLRTVAELTKYAVRERLTPLE
jgi:DNA-binding NarL/FixJ family response regulator